MRRVFIFISFIIFSSFSVFADAKVSMTFRSRPCLMETDDFKSFTFLDLDGYSSTSNAFTIKGSTECGGVELEIDPVITADSGTVSKSLSLEKYNGWVNFANGFMLKGGSWDSRAISRIHNNIESWEGIDFEPYKPGLTNSITVHKLGIDISEQCGTASAKQLAAMLQYKNNGFEIRGSAIYCGSVNSSTKSYWGYDEDGYSITDDVAFDTNVFFLEGGYTFEKAGRVMLSAKSDMYEYAACLSYEPSVFYNIKCMMDVTGEMVRYQNLSYARRNIYAYGADFRLRYALGYQLTFTTFNNITFNETEYNSTSTIVHYMAMENMVNALLSVNDNLKINLTVRHYTGDLDSVDGKYKPCLLTAVRKNTYNKIDWISNFRITPGFEYNFDNGSKVTVGAAFNILNVFSNQEDDDIKCSLQIPVVFQISI